MPGKQWFWIQGESKLCFNMWGLRLAIYFTLLFLTQFPCYIFARQIIPMIRSLVGNLSPRSNMEIVEQNWRFSFAFCIPVAIWIREFENKPALVGSFVPLISRGLQTSATCRFIVPGRNNSNWDEYKLSDFYVSRFSGGTMDPSYHVYVFQCSRCFKGYQSTM